MRWRKGEKSGRGKKRLNTRNNEQNFLVNKSHFNFQHSKIIHNAVCIKKYHLPLVHPVAFQLEDRQLQRYKLHEIHYVLTPSHITVQSIQSQTRLDSAELFNLKSDPLTHLKV